jgi:hypothetical protein
VDLANPVQGNHLDELVPKETCMGDMSREDFQGSDRHDRSMTLRTASITIDEEKRN